MLAPLLRKSASAALTLLLSATLLSACGSNNNDQPASSPSNPSSPSASQTPAQTEQASPAASESPASEPATRTYKDALDRTVEIPTSPKRIIAHYYAAEMTALGVPMIGTNHINAKLALTEEQLQGIEDIGGESLVPNLEKTLTLEPDLILVPDFLEAKDLEALSKIAPTVAIGYGADAFTRLRALGDLIGESAKAEEWINRYNEKTQEKRSLVQSRIGEGETASAFVIYMDKQLYVYNKQRLGPTMYDAFGFAIPPKVTELFASEPETLWKTISLETLPDYAGDRMFLISTDDSEEAKKVIEEVINGPVWKSLPAVKNGKAYIVGKRWSMNDPLTLDWLLDEMAGSTCQITAA